MENRRIRGLRLELGLSQERFARLVGVSLQTVRRWEEGISKPLPVLSLKLEELQRKLGGAGVAEEKKKEERESGFGLGGLLKGLGSLFDLVSRMAEEGQDEYTRTGEISGLGGKATGVYGFSVKMGLGGKPTIEQFGNIKATEKGAVVAEVRGAVRHYVRVGESVGDLLCGELPVHQVDLAGLQSEVLGLGVQVDLEEELIRPGTLQVHFVFSHNWNAWYDRSYQ